MEYDDTLTHDETIEHATNAFPAVRSQFEKAASHGSQMGHVQPQARPMRCQIGIKTFGGTFVESVAHDNST